MGAIIQNYTDFCTELLKAGFSGAVGGRDDGVFRLFGYGWGAELGDAVCWHTGDPQTDPWEWRIRVLNERDDIAYAKLFFRKAGYVTKEWYPYFLAARRGGQTFAGAYADGTVSQSAKRIYQVLLDNGPQPLDAIKRLGSFGREDKSRFDGALTELQMRLFVTMCGRQQKISSKGEEYGWASTMFCTVEEFWPAAVFEKAGQIGASEAEQAIADRIYALNPAADGKKVRKFIYGR